MLCSIDGCTRKRKYVNTGWCQTHYHRWWRTGDPLGVKQLLGASGPDAVSWKADEISYRTAHERVWKRRGRAAEHSCTECGCPAEQWAYDHTDENQKWATFGDRVVAYSTDVERYRPMCRGCHVKLDRGRKSGWPKKALTCPVPDA